MKIQNSHYVAGINLLLLIFQGIRVSYLGYVQASSKWVFKVQ